MNPEIERNILFALIGGCYLVYRFVHIWRWWRGLRSRRNTVAVEGEEISVLPSPIPSSPPSPSPLPAPSDSAPLPAFSPSEEPVLSPSEESGEELYARARTLPHLLIPSFDTDAPYLTLLGRSAALGYAPALTKLGEYAMRREAWVEAYYWMKRAQRSGMHGLASVLREIARNWAMDGYSDQSVEVNSLFTLEAASIARALLWADSGRGARDSRVVARDS